MASKKYKEFLIQCISKVKKNFIIAKKKVPFNFLNLSRKTFFNVHWIRILESLNVKHLKFLYSM
jgi:hypothetical protein